MRLLLRDGIDRGAPVWIMALQMAEDWGVPPWVVMEYPGSLVWAARWAFYHKQVRWVRDNT